MLLRQGNNSSMRASSFLGGDGTCDVDGDSNGWQGRRWQWQRWWQWQWRWLMVTAAEMADGNGNGDSRWQRQRRWPMAMAMATAAAMATETATAIAMATATETAMMMLLSRQLTQGRVASSCAGNVQGKGDALPPPPGHKGVCIAQRYAMGVPMQRVSAPFQGEGSWQLTMDCFF